MDGDVIRIQYAEDPYRTYQIFSPRTEFNGYRIEYLSNGQPGANLEDPIGSGDDAATAPCAVVAIEDLYADARPYADQEICTEGLLQEWYPGVLLVPAFLSEEEAGFRNLQLGWRETLGEGFHEGDRVRVRGVFSFFEDCYDFHVVHAGDQGDIVRVCGPPDVPMSLELYEIEAVIP